MMSYFVSDFPSEWPGASDWLGAQLSGLRGSRRAAEGKWRGGLGRTSTEIGSRVATRSGAIVPAPAAETDDFEERLRQVRREYACKLPGKVFALAACLDQPDKGLRVLAEARELAHRMKKTSETHGFEHVAELASRLERNLSHLVDDRVGGAALILREIDELLADLVALAEREFGAHWAADLARQSGKAD
jgi:HPt (histidine-containing phosphotransfer) domain-containing protein